MPLCYATARLTSPPRESEKRAATRNLFKRVARPVPRTGQKRDSWSGPDPPDRDKTPIPATGPEGDLLRRARRRVAAMVLREGERQPGVAYVAIVLFALLAAALLIPGYTLGF